MANFTHMASVEYHHGNLKMALIQAGEAELNRVGSASELSLREIARVAGVSHNAPYRHFSNKEELLNELIERSINELADQILSAPLLYPASLLMQVQYVGRLWALVARRHPQKASMMFNAYNAHHEILKLNLASVLKNSQELDTNDETDMNRLALILIAAFNGLALISVHQHLKTSENLTQFRTDEDLYSHTDEAAQFILRSAMLSSRP